MLNYLNINVHYTAQVPGSIAKLICEPDFQTSIQSLEIESSHCDLVLVPMSILERVDCT